MDCDFRKKKILFYLTEKLMREAGLQIRDTWDGFEGENNDDIHANHGHGPKRIEILETDSGPARLETEKVQWPQFNNLSYDKSKILIPRHLIGKIHPVIHEAVHFLQYNTTQLDDDYKTVKSESAHHYKQYVSQRAEYEAFYIQILFIDRYEQELTNQVLLKGLKKRLARAKKFPHERVGFICWAHKNHIV